MIVPEGAQSQRIAKALVALALALGAATCLVNPQPEPPVITPDDKGTANAGGASESGESGGSSASTGGNNASTGGNNAPSGEYPGTGGRSATAGSGGAASISADAGFVPSSGSAGGTCDDRTGDSGCDPDCEAGSEMDGKGEGVRDGGASPEGPQGEKEGAVRSDD